MRFRSLRLLVAFLRRRSIRLALVMSLFSALLLWSLLPAVTISKPATSRPDHPPVAWFHRRHLVAAGNETCKYTSSEGLVIADEMGRVCQLTDAALNGCCQMGSSSLVSILSNPSILVSHTGLNGASSIEFVLSVASSADYGLGRFGKASWTLYRRWTLIWWIYQLKFICLVSTLVKAAPAFIAVPSMSIASHAAWTRLTLPYGVMCSKT
eukprot:m.42936 g.42936  ORF g.42936 m.42936 type:complete len:210 (-) comp11990_c0_seq2:625-1254(-)